MLREAEYRSFYAMPTRLLPGDAASSRRASLTGDVHGFRHLIPHAVVDYFDSQRHALAPLSPSTPLADHLQKPRSPSCGAMFATELWSRNYYLYLTETLRQYCPTPSPQAASRLTYPRSPCPSNKLDCWLEGYVYSARTN